MPVNLQAVVTFPVLESIVKAITPEETESQAHNISFPNVSKGNLHTHHREGSCCEINEKQQVLPFRENSRKGSS